MGVEIAALMGFFGLTSAFALVATILAAWMAWRIVEKTGLPGWAGLGAILLTLTGVGSIVPLVLLWVFAFMRWPRDEPAACCRSAMARRRPVDLPGPRRPARWRRRRRPWPIGGDGSSPAASVALAIDGSATAYVLTGAPAAQPTELSVPDPSVGQPHARLLIAAGRLGLEDLGTAGRDFHRRRAPPARARSARHQRGPLDPPGHGRARPVAGLKECLK